FLTLIFFFYQLFKHIYFETAEEGYMPIVEAAFLTQNSYDERLSLEKPRISQLKLWKVSNRLT
ncbi:MAG: hypothetical protein JTT16_03635, partial [Candidatus Brockarchaeota archaeon]|nr:hypothetical protein [Candidatus Brockarchaeota archaeon]